MDTFVWIIKDTKDGSEIERQADSPAEAYQKACEDGLIPIVNGRYVPFTKYVVVPKSE